MAFNLASLLRASQSVHLASRVRSMQDWDGDIGGALDTPTARTAPVVDLEGDHARAPASASSDDGDVTAELSDVSLADASSRAGAAASDTADWPAEPDTVSGPAPRTLTHSFASSEHGGIDPTHSPLDLPTPFEFPSNGVHLAFAPDPTDTLPDATFSVAVPETPDLAADDSAAGAAFTSVSLSPEHPQVRLQRERLGKTTLDGFGHRAESPTRASAHKRTSSIKSVGSRPSSRLDTAPHPNGAAARSASSVASSAGTAAAEPEAIAPARSVSASAVTAAAPVAGPSKPRAPLNKKSALDKHLSKVRRDMAVLSLTIQTRQRDLPPKNREEDKKHLKEFNTMLVGSKKGGALCMSRCLR